MENDILLWGDLCIDKNDIAGQKIFSPGGSSFYCSRILKALGHKPLIISPRGADYNMDWLDNIPVFPENSQSENTLVFHNNYDLQGKRTLYAQHRDCACFIDPYSLPENYYTGAKAAVVCPIDNNVSYENVKRLKEKLDNEVVLASLPQGFFRRYQEDGRVYQSQWRNENNIVSLLNIIFLSEEDGENLDEKAIFWNSLGSLVVITRADRGCSVFENGKRKDFSAFKVEKIVDPVGAGDVFSAAFISSWLLEKNVKKAAVFANATAALSLSFHALEMDINTDKINKLIFS